MALAELRRRIGGHRRAEIDAVLAAVALAVALRDRGDVAVAHAGLDGGEGGAHGAVLHRGGAADQFLLLGALDDFDRVDQIGGVDETGVGKASLLQVVDQRKRHLIGADEPDRAAGIGRQRLRREFRRRS